MKEQDAPIVVERMELARLAGKLAESLGYLRRLVDLRRLEGWPYSSSLSKMRDDMETVHHRLTDLALQLPEGPLEAFGREHPLHYDDVDGVVYCGYGAKEGRPYTCPVKDSVLHWEAWELRGTTHQRPAALRNAGAAGGDVVPSSS